MDVDLRRIVPIILVLVILYSVTRIPGEEIARVRNLKELQTFFCRACGVLLISYQPESRIALVLFSCMFPVAEFLNRLLGIVFRMWMLTVNHL